MGYYTPPYVGTRTYGCNRNSTGIQQVSIGTPSTRASHIGYKLNDNIDIRGIQFTFGNFIPGTTGAETSSFSAFTLSACIDFPIGLTRQLLFGGQPTILVNPGAIVTCDMMDIPIPRKSQFLIKVNRAFADQGGNVNAIENMWQNPYTGVGEGYANAGNLTTDYSISGTFSAALSNNTFYGPMLMTVIPSSPTRSFLIVGDSICDGQGDTKAASNVGQGDYLSSATPSTLFPGYGNQGWCAKLLNNKFPYYNVSFPSKQLTSWGNPSNNAKALSIADSSPPSDVILALGVNDFTNGLDANTNITALSNLADFFLNRYMGCKVWVATVTPRSASTDGFITTTNQNFTGVGVTPAFYSDTSTSTCRLTMNSKLLARTVLTQASGVLDVAGQCQDSTDPRKWRADMQTLFPTIAPTNAATLDGTHPYLLMHTYIGGGGGTLNNTIFG